MGNKARITKWVIVCHMLLQTYIFLFLSLSCTLNLPLFFNVPSFSFPFFVPNHLLSLISLSLLIQPSFSLLPKLKPVLTSPPLSFLTPLHIKTIFMIESVIKNFLTKKSPGTNGIHLSVGEQVNMLGTSTQQNIMYCYKKMSHQAMGET